MVRTCPALHVTVAGGSDEQAAVLASEFPVTAMDELGSGRWRFFFENIDDRDRAVARLVARPGLDVEAIDVSDEDWATKSQACLTAVTIGDIVIAPPWDVPVPTGDRRVIVIEPSMGFGTGHHQSTRLCVLALQEIFLAKAGAAKAISVLDVGTGSGVLAIAASLLGAHDVAGIDVDPDAVESARRNVALNPPARVNLQCSAVQSFGGPPRDLVLANLIMELLRRHAESLDALVNAGGFLIASGFTAEQEQDVRSAFSARPTPFRTFRRFVEGDWVALALQKLN